MADVNLSKPRTPIQMPNLQLQYLQRTAQNEVNLNQYELKRANSTLIKECGNRFPIDILHKDLNSLIAKSPSDR